MPCDSLIDLWGAVSAVLILVLLTSLVLLILLVLLALLVLLLRTLIVLLAHSVSPLFPCASAVRDAGKAWAFPVFRGAASGLMGSIGVLAWDYTRKPLRSACFFGKIKCRIKFFS
jgi:uncharacterized membrane protein